MPLWVLYAFKVPETCLDVFQIVLTLNFKRAIENDCLFTIPIAINSCQNPFNPSSRD